MNPETKNTPKYRGRGSSVNPANRFLKLHIDESPDFANDEEPADEKKVATTYLLDDSKTVIAKNDSEDLHFDYSFNPYRGCEHGCVYCYARPGHEYLGFSSGLDFETRIVIKKNAPALLAKEFRKKSYTPTVLMFSGNTDCYQPVERSLNLTNESLKVCLHFRNPVSIITKNSLIERDIDILAELHKHNLISVMLSVTTLDEDLARKLEPRTSTPQRRLRTIKMLADKGIPTGVNIAPIIPGLTDNEIPAILKAASDSGAVFASRIMLRLPYSVKEIFINWLKSEYPDRARKVIGRIKEIRGGKLNDNRFGLRFRGEGVFADSIHHLFELNRKKYNLDRFPDLKTEHFRRDSGLQADLFGN